eukprot:TRINITY_DN15811_c0_g1_i1.p1 TRINITY_DN15811_c0_g1~~TRINITY_DN15811_c0_g1_i1.p1  ORF type:complete len:703 (+),score=115.00 TRINITY_DN15811_c0_g1_i1:92-2200(+)
MTDEVSEEGFCEDGGRHVAGPRTGVRFSQAPEGCKPWSEERITHFSEVSGSEVSWSEAEREAKIAARTSRFSVAVAALHEDLGEKVVQRLSSDLPVGRKASLASAFRGPETIFTKIVRSKIFALIVAMVIIGNTIMIGVDQSYELQEKHPGEMLAVESICLVLYLVELLLRILAFGLRPCLNDGWIRFDIFLIVSGITCTWLLSVAMLADLPSWLSRVSMLRTARIFRLARMVRLVPALQPLWILCQGVLHSINTMSYVLIVLVCIVYMSACVGFDIIGKHELLADPDTDERFREVAEMHFSSLPASMLTVLSFLVFDSVRNIYWPLVAQDPSLIVYFLFVFLLLGVVVANLITAVIVNSSFEQASADKETKAINSERAKRRLLNSTMMIFRELDEDGSGIITRDEVDYMSATMAAQLESLIGIRDPAELFAVLDWDDTGEVEMDEFLRIVEHIASNPGQNLQFVKIANTLKRMHQSSVNETSGMQVAIQALADRFDEFSKAFSSPSSSPRGARSGLEAAATEGEAQQAAEEDLRLQTVAQYGRQAAAAAAYFNADRLEARHRTRLLPDSAPLWATKVYESLLEELDRSTTQILTALRRGSSEEGGVPHARGAAIRASGEETLSTQDTEWCCEPLPSGTDSYKVIGTSEATLARTPRALRIAATDKVSRVASTAADQVFAAAAAAPAAPHAGLCEKIGLQRI